MKRLTLALVFGGLLAAVPVAQAQYPCSPYPAGVTYSPFYAQPYAPPTSPQHFVGNSFAFFGPPSFSASNYGPSYQVPSSYNVRYPNPGPYYFTPTYSYTPGYYSYYYTPGWFRY
jgi:hypothetical protein